MKPALKILGLSALAVGLISPASAWNILHITNNTANSQALYDWLLAEGHDVNRTYRTNGPGDAADYDLIWIDRALTSTDFTDSAETTAWNAVPKPLINACPYIWRDTRWGWMNGDAVLTDGLSDSYDSPYPDPSHPFVTGLGTTIMTQAELRQSASAALPAAAEVVATTEATTRHGIFYLEKGIFTFGSHGMLGAARVGITLGDEGDFQYLNADGEQIVRNIIDFMVDRDNDGMPDHFEDQYFGNNNKIIEPLIDLLEDGNGDYDSDGLFDIDEYYYNTNPKLPDTDFDSLTDGDEINVYFSDPNSIDSDSDTIWDGHEVNGTQNPWIAGDPNAGPPGEPTNPANADSDYDGINDRQEIITGADGYITDPNNEDSDNDGYSDSFEIANDDLPIDSFHPTENSSAGDPDQDGLNNGDELTYGADPLDADTDDDTLGDGDEVSGAANPFGDPTSPADVDTDGDGITDNEEVVAGADGYVTNPANWDTDGDGYADDFEIANDDLPNDPFNPLVDDATGDPDGDGLNNDDEIFAGTDAVNPDSDGDGRLDGDEVNGSPTSDPTLPDTDGDLANDGDEVDNGTDPNDPNDFPKVAWLQVDFSRADAFEPSTVNEAFYQSYLSYDQTSSDAVDPSFGDPLGVDRVDEPFDATFYSTATTVLLTVEYPDAMPNPIDNFTLKRSLDRGALIANYEGTKPELIRDWIGVDARPPQGNGADVPTTLRMTLDDLPAGDYLLRTYHHDAEIQGPRFGVVVTDADSTAALLPALFRQTTGATGSNPDDPGAGNGPENLRSTLEQVIRSDGSSPIVIDFATQDQGGDGGILVINGFELTETVDSDGDDLVDATEVALFGAITVTDGTGDQDSDGITDLTEILQNTNPNSNDTDGDGLADGLETDTGSAGSASVEITSFSTVPDATNPTISIDWTPAVASDILGSLDLTDFPIPVASGVTPPVTDLSLPPAFDGEPAGFFMVDPPSAGFGTSPFLSDSDGDGVSDGDEVNIYGSDPNNTETDGDGFTDGHEVLGGSDPVDPASVPDQDGDGYANSTELNAGTDPDDAGSYPTADPATQLWVDFNSNQDEGGDSTTDPDPALSTANHLQLGWSSYHANHEVAAEFATANYTAFGAAVTVTPTWPDTTDNLVMQSIDRTNQDAAGTVLGSYDANWDGDTVNLLTDWIGADSRPANGGNGVYDPADPATWTRMDLTLGNLPAGTYSWTSFHHDTENMWPDFKVQFSVDGGATFVPADGVDLENATLYTVTDSTPGGAPASPQTYDGPANPGSLLPEDLPSTFTTSFTADGANNVVFRFIPHSDVQVHRSFFVMNGFKLEKQP